MNRRVRVRKDRRDARFWDDQHRNAASLGCSHCPELHLCGGLHTASGAFNCLTYCCGGADTCTTVCQRNPTFVERVREISGFDLNQIAYAPRQPFPQLPPCIPLIYARGRRREPFRPECAAVSLYRLIDCKRREIRFRSREQLLGHFGLDPSTEIIASGTAPDAALERWWQLGGSARLEMLKHLGALGIVAITAPNFSVFSDVPRWDNFYDMKRIALSWREILDAGMPAALHVNARAVRDWDRWAEFVRHHVEIDAIAYEFATGAATRRSYHVQALCCLADRVARRLNLVVRGGLPALAQLSKSYAPVSMIDSSTYMRSANRKFAVIREDGAIEWKNAPDRPATDMDSLIEHNHLTVLRVTREKLASSAIPMSAVARAHQGP